MEKNEIISHDAMCHKGKKVKCWKRQYLAGAGRRKPQAGWSLLDSAGR